jgi:hypothetical protein
MPGKMARSAPRPPFRLAAVPVTVGTSRLSCGKAVKCEYSRQFGSHPGNPGLSLLHNPADTDARTITTTRALAARNQSLVGLDRYGAAQIFRRRKRTATGHESLLVGIKRDGGTE